MLCYPEVGLPATRAEAGKLNNRTSLQLNCMHFTLSTCQDKLGAAAWCYETQNNMETLLLYILKAALCLSILFWVYKQFLQELAFLSWSRLFFLLALLISFVVPLFELPLMPVELSPALFYAFSAYQDEVLLVGRSVPDFNRISTSTWLVRAAFGVYGLGFVLFLLNIVRQFLKQQHTKQKAEKADGVYWVQSAVPAWSFFSWIFLSNKLRYLPHEQRQQVLLHERAHAKQWHSVDTLLYELATAVLWFNPLMPAIKREVHVLHEYLADREVTKQFNPQNYSRLILMLVNGKLPGSLAEGFTNQQVKKRLLMLNKPQESEWKKLRFLLVAPLVAALLAVFGLIDHVVLRNTSPDALSNTAWQFPFTGRFAIVQPFIKEKKVRTANELICVSYPKVSVVAEANQDVVAIGQGEILNVWNSKQGAHKKYGISLKVAGNRVLSIDGLAKLYVQRGERVARKQKLGRTGEASLFPTITIELWKNHKRVDPLLLY